MILRVTPYFQNYGSFLKFGISKTVGFNTKWSIFGWIRIRPWLRKPLYIRISTDLFRNTSRPDGLRAFRTQQGNDQRLRHAHTEETAWVRSSFRRSPVNEQFCNADTKPGKFVGAFWPQQKPLCRWSFMDWICWSKFPICWWCCLPTFRINSPMLQTKSPSLCFNYHSGKDKSVFFLMSPLIVAGQLSVFCFMAHLIWCRNS